MTPGLWQRFIAWFRRWLGRARASRLLTEGAGDEVWPKALSLLPADLRRSIGGLEKRGVVGATVAGAIEDYGHLHELVAGERNSLDAVFDATLLADAELLVRSIVDAAPALTSVVMVARERGRDRSGREAAGSAILAMQDRARILSDAATAALAWSANPSDAAARSLRAAADRLAS